MENSKESAADLGAWKDAKALAALFGYIPSTFSSSIRMMVADHYKNNRELRPASKYQISRVLGTPSFTCMLYFASKDLRSGYFSGIEYLTIGMLMDYFDPMDLAALVASYVYVRKGKKLLGPENWDLLKDRLETEFLIGAHMGVSIPKIGIGVGLLLGIMRHFGQMSFLLKDNKLFREYRRELKNNNRSFDAEREKAMFGCSATEVAVVLLSNFGFGVEIGHAFAGAFEKVSLNATDAESIPYSMKMGRLWIDALLDGKRQPDVTIPAHFYPMASDHEIMDRRILRILRGERGSWFDHGKNDLNAQTAPELFKKPKFHEDIPDEIARVFSLEQIEKMEVEDFDDLIDQLDNEQAGKVKPGSITLSAKEIQELEQMVSEG